MTALREVRLYGVLGRRFGRVHRLAVDSAAEAIRALCVVVDGFEAHLARYSQPGYHVFSGRQNLSEDDLGKPTGREVIRVVPAVVGAKRGGVLQTIIGAVLIVAGVYFGVPQLVQVGIAMMIGGVVQMLSPQRKANEGDKAQGTPSYSFNGAANTDAEGGCVPVLYGQLLVGSVVISGGIRTQDIAI